MLDEAIDSAIGNNEYTTLDQMARDSVKTVWKENEGYIHLVSCSVVKKKDGKDEPSLCVLRRRQETK